MPVAEVGGVFVATANVARRQATWTCCAASPRKVRDARILARRANWQVWSNPFFSKPISRPLLERLP
jgi:hypothetical protein